MEGRDAKGEPMGREELVAEALTQMIAGSDTTSNTSCAMLYHVLNNHYIIPKLQKELDAALSKPGVPSFEEVKDLP
jgi:benzoate 4-monooxygenase